jgi:preprotein translocase subunit SecE
VAETKSLVSGLRSVQFEFFMELRKKMRAVFRPTRCRAKRSAQLVIWSVALAC